MAAVIREIFCRDDLEELLTVFYSRLLEDESLRHFFTTVIPLDMAHHLPLITDFWEAVVFGRHTYSKNVMAVHQHINHLSTIQPEHLDKWVMVFNQTLDALFVGTNAELMKQRAQSIATLMKIKLASSSINKT